MVDFAAHTARILHRLGQPVTVTPVGGEAREIRAVFSAKPAVAFDQVAGYLPTLSMAAADAVGLADGDSVVIGADAYTIRQLHDDSRDSGEIVADLKAV